MIEPRYVAQHVSKYQHGIVGYDLRFVSNSEVQLQIQIGLRTLKIERAYENIASVCALL